MFSISRSRGCAALLLFILLLASGCVTAFQITGALGGIKSNGERPLRVEIHDFETSGPAFDLFILATLQFQQLNQSDQLSYFQIAGIHGLPREPWDDVVGSGPNSGYCTHAATPFPPWHRAYMALYEQLIWQNAQEIATAYPDAHRELYINAAVTLRHPFWDFAVFPELPDVVVQPQITVNTPVGQLTIPNPLYQYVFQAGVLGKGFPPGFTLANLPQTVRWWTPTTLTSNQSAANAALRNNAPTIQSLVYQMFTSVTNYTAFSCVWPYAQWDTGNSIESIHNSIHNSVGGYGHMGFPDYAGFDPIFWLHHANVDRLFAMWQALYPDNYIISTTNAVGTYFEAQGSVDAGDSVLAPFHSDNGSTLFTSDGVRSTSTFGYSYPELPDWQLSPDQLATNVKVAVNSLYGPSINGSIPRSSHESRARSTHAVAAFSHVSLDLARQLNVNNLNRQWSIKILVDRFALNTSFCIDFFMGNAPDDVLAWPTAGNLIGTHAQFISANVTMLYPHGAPQGQMRGEVSMTHILAAGVSRGALRDLSPRSVLPLLKNALTWKVRTLTGEEVPITAVVGLTVSVSTREVVPRPANDRFPQYGAVQWLDSATEGKPCGAGRRHKLAWS